MSDPSGRTPPRSRLQTGDSRGKVHPVHETRVRTPEASKPISSDGQAVLRSSNVHCAEVERGFSAIRRKGRGNIGRFQFHVQHLVRLGVHGHISGVSLIRDLRLELQRDAPRGAPALEPKQQRIAVVSVFLAAGVKVRIFQLGKHTMRNGLRGGPNGHPGDASARFDHQWDVPWANSGKLAVTRKICSAHGIAPTLGQLIRLSTLPQRRANWEKNRWHKRILEILMT